MLYLKSLVSAVEEENYDLVNCVKVNFVFWIK